MSFRSTTLLFTILGVLHLLGCDDSSDEPSSGANNNASNSLRCDLALGSSATGCPESTRAEDAWDEVRSACDLSDTDVDPSNLTLTDAAKPKVCVSCGCRQASVAYRTLYVQCTADDQDNATLSKNLHAIASSCE